MGIGIDIVVQKSPVDPVHGVTAPLIERIIEAVRTHTEYLKQESLFSVSKNRDLPQCQPAVGNFRHFITAGQISRHQQTAKKQCRQRHRNRKPHNGPKNPATLQPVTSLLSLPQLQNQIYRHFHNKHHIPGRGKKESFFGIPCQHQAGQM